LFEVFILQRGLAGYYLPRFRSFFAMIEPGDMFGHLEFKQSSAESGYDSESDDSDDSG